VVVGERDPESDRRAEVEQVHGVAIDAELSMTAAE
jgi:hypothetical protein